VTEPGWLGRAQPTWAGLDPAPKKIKNIKKYKKYKKIGEIEK
jgi:hypothetical protein